MYTKTPFEYYLNANRAAVRASFNDESVPASEVAKRAQEQWRSLNEGERGYYQNIAANAPAPVPAPRRSSPRRSSPRRSTYVPPAETPFSRYSQANRASVRGSFMDERVPASEVAKRLGEQWRNLSPSEQSMYTQAFGSGAGRRSSPRQLTPFERYAQENQLAVRNSMEEGAPRSEVYRELAYMWRNLTPEQQRRYE